MNIKSIRRTVSFAIFLVIILFINSFSQTLYEGGYADKFSVAQGETITFYISSSSQDSVINIFRITDKANYVTYIDSPMSVQIPPAHSDSTFWYGCGWGSTLKIKIPQTWAPGVYRAEFGTYWNADSAKNDSSSGILFFVKNDTLGNTSKNLLLIATNTWQAYNDYGGKSLYDNISSLNMRSYKVSFNRPANRPLGSLGSADFYKYEYKFINWATLNNIPLEYASMYDLDRNSKFLFKNNDNTQNLYDILFIVGHNEYWSIQEREQCERFIDNGGKVIILSGNTCWWQVRFEDNGQTMVCYKDTTLDRNANPLIPDSLLTTNWWKSPVNNPENSFTGVNFKDGGYVNSGTKLPKSNGFGDYAALNTQYWVFKGTWLRDGDEFGYDDAIVGYETDGTTFYWDSLGLPAVDKAGADEGTPINFRILATSPTIPYDIKPYGHATMGIYFKGNRGAVFNGATTDWADGLYTDTTNNNYPDPIVDRITKNVYDKFTQNRFPPEIKSWGPSWVHLVHPNYDPVYINVRDTMLSPNDSLNLFINASNPFPDLTQGPVNYFWKDFDGNVASHNNTFTFKLPDTSKLPDNFANVKKFTVAGYAYNNEDTASVSWNIFTSPLVILNADTVQIIPDTPFTYQVKVYNHYQDTLSFSLANLPDSLNLSIDSATGLITGTIPQTTKDTVYNFTIKVVNMDISRGDSLNFKLIVSGSVTGIENSGSLPLTFSLSQNYPNPFNPATTINYAVPEAGLVTLKIYDILGREVRTLVNGEKSPGRYSVNFDASALASGIYIYRITAGAYSSVKKMVLLK